MHETLTIIEGDITKAKEQYIAHQCNCITDHAKGLAATIFEQFPWADTYSQRKDGSKSEPGTIDVLGNGTTKRFVINMYGQYTPGKPRRGDSQRDRLSFFTSCLDKISEIENIKSVAFPYLIGCGLAKGNWNDYKVALEDFANKTGIQVVLYSFKPE